MRLSKLLAIPAIAAIGFFGFTATASAAVSPTCQQNCQGDGNHNGNNDNNRGNGNQCRDQEPGPWGHEQDEQYIHPWSSCCRTEVVWAHKVIWRHGHRTTVWYRTTVRDCSQHGDGNRGGNGGGGNQNGGGGGQGWNPGGPSHPLTSCTPRTFPVTVSHGIFTELPGGPILSNFESLMDGTHVYHVSDLQTSGNTVTFQLNGDTAPGTSLKTCP